MSQNKMVNDEDNVANLLLVQFERVLLAFAGLALFAMMVLITGNAIGRYLFNEPISGVLTATELYLLIGLIFFGLPYLQRIEGNIAVDILSKNFEERTQEGVKVVVRAVILVIVLLIVYDASVITFDRIQRRATTTGIIEWPTSVSWGIFTIGLTAFCSRLLIQIYLGLKHLVVDFQRKLR